MAPHQSCHTSNPQLIDRAFNDTEVNFDLSDEEDDESMGKKMSHLDNHSMRVRNKSRSNPIMGDRLINGVNDSQYMVSYLDMSCEPSGYAAPYKIYRNSNLPTKDSYNNNNSNISGSFGQSYFQNSANVLRDPENQIQESNTINQFIGTNLTQKEIEILQMLKNNGMSESHFMESFNSFKIKDFCRKIFTKC